MIRIEYTPIGIIRTPFKTPAGTPIQPTGADGVEAKVEVFPEYSEGLADLEGFSHIILLYLLFATRAPARPNPVGISVVRLVRIDGAMLYIKDVDVVDKTPLLDIKPYIPEFDIRKVDSTGWIGKKAEKVKKTQDDGRFAK
jgi:tRNA (Thr-GGU) A37 N-methylase